MITIVVAALIAGGLMLAFAQHNRPEPKRVPVRIRDRRQDRR